MTDRVNYILLLTAKPSGWGAKRLREASRERKIHLRAADPSKTMLEISATDLPVRIAHRKIRMPLAVIPRPGPGNYENLLAILAQFEAAGVPVCNSSDSIRLAHDTYLSLLKLKAAGINVPATARILSVQDLKTARKIIPGPPWILKTFTGSMGIGTMLMNAVDQLEAVAATLWALGQPILMQEYIGSREKRSADTRTLVIGRNVIGAIRRSAMPGEYRANVHRGGTPEEIDIPKWEVKLALKAADAIGLDITGVDWIETKSGPVILEVNATPGFQGFEEATGIDVAKEIIDYALKKGKG